MDPGSLSVAATTTKWYRLTSTPTELIEYDRSGFTLTNDVVINSNPLAGQVVADRGNVYLLHTDPHSQIWRYKGPPGNWEQIDGFPDSESIAGNIAAGHGSLYKSTYRNGGIRKYSGTPNVWNPIDLNTDSHVVAANNSNVYLMHWPLSAGDRGDVWEYNGSPFNWTKIYDVGNHIIAAGGDKLALLIYLDSVWLYQGVAFHWTKIYENPKADNLIATETDLFVRLQPTGQYLRYLGSPGNWENYTGPELPPTAPHN